jgi:hypothetical protein
MPGVRSVSVKDLTSLEKIAAELAEAQAAVEKLTLSRDKVVVSARKDGFAWPRIATAARLSRQGVEQAARRGNRGELPKPRQQG